jgi:tetratricopeptide (TPR) repeat protein
MSTTGPARHSARRGTRRAATLALIALLAALTASALPAQPMPDRPRLPAAADTNDWEAYYDYGASLLRQDPRRAEAAMRWAARLDPTRAEPLFAQYVTYWLRFPERFGQYLRDDEKVLRMPEVQAVDSLRGLAMRRNPFVHQGLIFVAYDQLPGRYREDVVTTAWLAYANGRMPQALALFGRAIERDPARYGYLRFTRAAAFVSQAAYDSALAEVTTLLADLRQRDEQQVGRMYESKAMLEYAAGLLQAQRRRTAEARTALGRATVENYAFAPAHAALGQLALARGDTAEAVREYALAVELDGADPVFRMGYGEALLRARRVADAVPHFQAVLRTEPHYAEVYLQLGVALEAAGMPAEARTAYGEFVRRAPRRSPALPQVRQRLQALGGG